jgi:DNA-binding transcriptional regulator YiaG
MEICSECGKNFICPPESIYKTLVNGRVKRQCSYTCWRQACSQKEEAHINSTRKINTNRREKMMDEVKIENRLRELRDRSRLTLQEVSTLTGFDITTISRHESGQRKLSEEAIDKYSALYKVKTHELFRL